MGKGRLTTGPMTGGADPFLTAGQLAETKQLPVEDAVALDFLHSSAGILDLRT